MPTDLAARRPSSADIDDDVRRALREDVGDGDLTAGLIPAATRAEAGVITRQTAVVSGGAWFDAVFRQLDPAIQIAWQVQDGDTVQPGQTLCTLNGPARGLLTGERPALNFLQTLSGTATRTRAYVDAIAGTGAVVLDTRKTLPGLRRAQKYAVLCGGGANHRIGLYDGILVKENHILAAGSIAAALLEARAAQRPGVLLEIEVENLDELQQALDAGAERVLLDNFELAGLRQAVALARGRARLEASGGVTLDTIRDIAATGVDYVSVGEITKNVRAVDLSMRFNAVPPPRQVQ